jgi:hypothetical protein
MKLSVSRSLSVWLVLLGCSTAFSQVYLLQAPQFAEAGQAVRIRAFVETPPTTVTLSWTSGTASGEESMTLNPQRGYWAADIPSDAVAGTELSYTVTAENDQGEAASPDCTLIITPAYTLLEPRMMELHQSTLAEAAWNSNDSAFGLLKPENGPPVGPASITYHKGRVYLLDSVKGRVLGFSKADKSRTATALPTSIATDLVVDPTDDSLVVVSQLEDKIYRFRNGKLNRTESVPMKKSYEYPAQFNYDRHSRSLYTQQPNRLGKRAAVLRQGAPRQAAERSDEQNLQVLTEVQDHQLRVKLDSNPQIFAVEFSQPVGFIDEAVVDENGTVWVLYTLKGDYRIRRLARIDTINAQAETALINVWFAFDATRRMTVTDSGVALMTGDEAQGRIVTFDYAGGL